MAVGMAVAEHIAGIKLDRRDKQRPDVSFADDHSPPVESTDQEGIHMRRIDLGDLPIWKPVIAADKVLQRQKQETRATLCRVVRAQQGWPQPARDRRSDERLYAERPCYLDLVSWSWSPGKLTLRTGEMANVTHREAVRSTEINRGLLDDMADRVVGQECIRRENEPVFRGCFS